MGSDDILEYWHKLHSKQFDWAFRAYERLVSTLSKDVQEKLQQTSGVSEPYIAVFGKTQVGKTTLILDLMGVDFARLSEISQVLRGGREAGKSATATALEYCRSVSDRWGLTLQGRTDWFDTNDDMTSALMDLREKMERGSFFTDSPCTVHIPLRFFIKGGSENGVRILDLPGDNPANKVEQEHVTKMAKTYLPFADLILLVGRGDDLSFLQPRSLCLPGIEDWQFMPHRFRVVTTYSYSAQSVKDFIRDNPDSDVEKVRERLLQQIELFGKLSDNSKDLNLFFPLEFGNSWISLENSEPALYARLVPIIAELRLELLDQIKSSTTQMGRFRNMLNTHYSIKYVHNRKKELIGGEISALKEKERTINRDAELWRSSIEKSRIGLSKAAEYSEQNNVNEWLSIIDESINKYINNRFPYPPKENGDKNNSETLRRMIRDYYQSLMGFRPDLKVHNENQNYYLTKIKKNVLEPDIKSILDSYFAIVRKKLDGHYFDQYLFPSNYNTDRDSVRFAGKCAENAIRQGWKLAFKNGLHKAVEELKTERHFLEMKLNVDSEELLKLQKKLDAVSKDISCNRHLLEVVEYSAKKDLERFDRLIDFLDQEYLAEICERIDLAYGEDDDCDSFLQILSCAELIGKREELIGFYK